MAGAISPYAPGIVGDEPAPPPRIPERPALFIAAAFVMALIGPGLLGPSWKAVLDALGVAGRQTAAFHVLAFAPAALSLVWGSISDRWPLMNARRESYLVLAALIAAGTWLAPMFLMNRSLLVLDACGMVAAHALASVAIGGALVEIGRRLGITSRLAAAWIAALSAADLAELAVTSVIGRSAGPLKIGLCTGLPAAVVIALLVLPRKVPAAPAAPALTSLRNYLRGRALWIWVTVLFLAALASLPDAVILQGDLFAPTEALMFAGQVAGGIVYAFASRRLHIPRGGRLALILNLVVMIPFARIGDQSGPLLIAAPIALGLVEGFKFAALTDITLRMSPPGHEGFVCALLTAVFQIGWDSRLLLQDAVGLSVSSVTTVTTVAAVAAVVASALLPTSLVARREGDY